jgi:hypothetical protein
LQLTDVCLPTDEPTDVSQRTCVLRPTDVCLLTDEPTDVSQRTCVSRRTYVSWRTDVCLLNDERTCELIVEETIFGIDHWSPLHYQMDKQP